MAKRPFGTYDAHRIVRSSYGSIDVMPDDETLENKRIGWRADVHNANAMKRYQHEQMIARMRSRIASLKSSS
jgi:hypothetical protein|tara:strand:- start:1182 stop:1397 length:216 start_codon:yes stop_codon:yes gene_type:complete